ncbi:MAG: FtsK/SpoIIIE domain-containing protein, partial [Bacilli bacterium]
MKEYFIVYTNTNKYMYYRDLIPLQVKDFIISKQAIMYQAQELKLQYGNVYQLNEYHIKLFNDEYLSKSLLLKNFIIIGGNGHIKVAGIKKPVLIDCVNYLIINNNEQLIYHNNKRVYQYASYHENDVIDIGYHTFILTKDSIKYHRNLVFNEHLDNTLIIPSYPQGQPELQETTPLISNKISYITLLTGLITMIMALVLFKTKQSNTLFMMMSLTTTLITWLFTILKIIIIYIKNIHIKTNNIIINNLNTNHQSYLKKENKVIKSNNEYTLALYPNNDIVSFKSSKLVYWYGYQKLINHYLLHMIKENIAQGYYPILIVSKKVTTFYQVLLLSNHIAIAQEYNDLQEYALVIIDDPSFKYKEHYYPKTNIIIINNNEIYNPSMYFYDSNKIKYHSNEGVFDLQVSKMHFKQDMISLISYNKAITSIENNFIKHYQINLKDANQLYHQWQKTNSKQGLPILIGHDQQEGVFLNPVDGYDGSHGLIAGMSGSGKSTLLALIITSLAYNYPPSQVNFLFIDYKGGALGQHFKDLAHFVGSITNLDEYQALRSIKAIKNEIKRRQELFLQHQIDHISEYQAKAELPYLYIVCDEVAQLKYHVLDLYKQLLHIAQIGRSLGLYLLLATQKPSGIIDDQIEANISYRICLKVATISDSMALLKTDQAYYLKPLTQAIIKTPASNKIIELMNFKTNSSKVWHPQTKPPYTSRFKEVINYISSYQVKRMSIIKPALPMEFKQTSTNDYIIGLVENSNDFKHQLVSYQKGHLLLCGTTNSGLTPLVSNLIWNLLLRLDQALVFIITTNIELYQSYLNTNNIVIIDLNDLQVVKRFSLYLESKTYTKTNISKYLIIDGLYQQITPPTYEILHPRLVQLSTNNYSLINLIIISKQLSFQLKQIKNFQYQIYLKHDNQESLNNSLNEFKYSNQLKVNQGYLVQDDIKALILNTASPLKQLSLIDYNNEYLTNPIKNSNDLWIGYDYFNHQPIEIELNKSLVIKCESNMVSLILKNYIIKHLQNNHIPFSIIEGTMIREIFKQDQYYLINTKDLSLLDQEQQLTLISLINKGQIKASYFKEGH